MTDDTCGSTDTATGDPCQRQAGWGTDLDHGRCKAHRERGRPTKLTYDRQEAIAAAIEDGDPIVAACRKNGITHKTHTNWMDRGKQQDEGVFADYFRRLAHALGHDQSEKTDVVWERAKAEGDVDAMLTVLKQRYPETWQDQDLGEAKGGAGDTPIMVIERDGDGD